MNAAHDAPLADLRNRIAAAGHAFVSAAPMRAQIEAHGALHDWAAFADSWNDLPRDEYMADQGRYRRRRHAVFSADAQGQLVREAHQPHYQGLEYNALNGGVARWFAPVDAAVADGASLRTLLGYCHALFAPLAADVQRWKFEVHQFRIEATPEMPGLPTPEGIHRDGVDYVMVLLIRRHNIASGTTLIHTPEGDALGSFTLTAPFDAALIDDHRVYHGVTAVTPLDVAHPAHRDVLVVTLRRASALS